LQAVAAPTRNNALADCSQCHGIDRNSYSSNLAAPAFDDIANIPGMTSRALTVALRTSHRSMPNLVVKGRDAEDLVAYILSLKRTEESKRSPPWLDAVNDVMYVMQKRN
jgi:mono/diheme cytochrome c family protein